MGSVIAVQLHSPEKGAGTQLSSLTQIIFLSAAYTLSSKLCIHQSKGLRMFDLDEVFWHAGISFFYSPPVPPLFLTPGWGKMAVTVSPLSNWVILFSWTLCFIFLLLVLPCAPSCAFLKFRILYIYLRAFGSLHSHSPSFAVFVQLYKPFLLAASNTDAMWWPCSLLASLH